MNRTGVTVLGAGPAGCIAALCLSQSNVEVTVIDVPQQSARSRSLRIDTLSTAARGLLSDLGLSNRVDESSIGAATDRKSKWHGPVRHQRDAGHGLLIDRHRFDESLRLVLLRSDIKVVQDRALSTHQFDQGWRIGLAERRSSSVTSAFLVDARGTAGGHPRLALGPRRVAVRATVGSFGAGRTLLEATSNAWVWGASGAEEGVVMAVIDPIDVAGLDQRERSLVLKNHCAQTELFRSVAIDPSTEVAVIGAAASASQDPVGPSHLRIGDAALCYDPIAGQGLNHALRSAAQAAPIVATLLSAEGDHAAATAFALDRHTQAAQQHVQALARIHGQADQRAPFWKDYACSAPAEALQSIRPRFDKAETATFAHGSPVGEEAGTAAGDIHLELADATTIDSVPALFGDRISRAPALSHPGLAEPVAFVNGRPISALLPMLATPATVQTMVQQLAPLLGGQNNAERFVTSLLETGVLHGVQARSNEGPFR